jgi:polysaccharide deacetylase 2 family uncharacterized protein YibQ
MIKKYLSKLQPYKKLIAFGSVNLLLVLTLLYMMLGHYYFGAEENSKKATELGQRVIINLSTGKIEGTDKKALAKIGESEPIVEPKPTVDLDKDPNAKNPVESPTQAIDAPKPEEKINKVKIVITNLGVNKAETDAALKLAPNFTLAFNPYGNETSLSSKLSKDAGHKVLALIPMQTGIPQSSSGVLALKIENNEFRNSQNFEAALSRVYMPDGLFFASDEIFTKSANFSSIAKQIADKKLPIVSAKTEVSDVTSKANGFVLNVLGADSYIAQNTAPLDVEAGLKIFSENAMKKDNSVLVIEGSKANLDILSKWYPTLKDSKLELAPF